jgi:multiple sugar transport system permease protein
MLTHVVRRGLFWALTVLIVIWSLGPFLWQLSSSFQADRDLTNRVPTWVPLSGTLEHYASIFAGRAFGDYILNSVIVAVSATVLGLVLASAAAFALARLPFLGKGLVLAVILGMSMFPQISIVTPLYLLLNELRLLDTYTGLSGAYIGLSLPLMVYILYGHFRAIPREIDEAAMIDGASLLRTLRSVIVPMAVPGMVTAFLLGFITNWNEFMLALAFTTTPEHQTIPVGIANFTTLYFVPWGDMAAASVVVTLPLVALVMIFQRRIVAGLTAGAVKG